MWVDIARDADDLERHLSAWQSLAENALEPNCFYEPWMLLPAVRAFGTGQRLLFALVYRRASASAAPRLCGFFPLEESRRLKGFPVRHLALWKHVHCFLGTPLLDPDHGREAVEALIAWVRNDRRGAGVLDFKFVTGDGPFAQLLIDVLQERITVIDETFNRALIRRGADGATYLNTTLSAGNRKELRRQRRRLTELGKLEARTLQPGGDINAWIEDFLALEAQGWKGQENTALASSQVERDYFAAIAREAFARNRLVMLGLFLDGKPIALKCNFLAGRGGFTFKIAYDESFAKYSPGVQLELDNIEHLHRQPTLEWLDSCASARHFMINRLWRERRTIQSVLISTGRRRGDLLVAALPFLRAVRRLLKETLAMRAVTSEKSAPVDRGQPAASPLLDIDAATFQAKFDREPFLIGHRLCEHRLFELPRLLELARALPEKNVEYNAGDVPLSLAPELTPRTGLSIEETIRRIADCKSWMVLKNVEDDPAYRDLLHQCLAEVRAHSEPLRPGMELAQAFVFITSPGSITPFHMDPEHNFLLQIRGSKNITQFDGRERAIVTEEDLERFYSGSHRNMTFKEEFRAKSWTFELKPGFGLHFPVTYPHFVQNGPEVSISFSITFRTPDLERRAILHSVNHRLRSRGWGPAPVGQHPWKDQLKYTAYRVWRKARKLMGRPI